jgi:hypothetical protein
MDCLAAQEMILESLDSGLAAADQGPLQQHLSGCDPCSRFAEAQRALDHKLAQSIHAPALSRDFDTSLRARLRPHRRDPWASWLPDAAYFAGAGVAVALCAALLPLPAAVVVPVGAGVALVAYAVQAIFVSVLEEASS